jgi:hypothetical protein
MKFKIVFPVGHQIDDLNDDNIDVNIILINEDVFFGTLFTIANIQSLLLKGDRSFFWATDMIIVKDLRRETIDQAIQQLIDDEFIYSALTKIGTLKQVMPNVTSFESICRNN